MRIFGLRWPLWATLVPLLAAMGAYAWWWQGRLDAYRAKIIPWLGTGATYGGFPYRFQADAGPLTRTLVGTDTRLTLSVDRLTVDRQPWSAALSVLGFAHPRIAAAAPGLMGASAALVAPQGRASLDTAFGRLTRLSGEFTDAVVSTGLLPVPIHAHHFEMHVRETPVAPFLLPTGPRMPTQAEAVLRGEGVQLGGGDALALEARLAVTAASPLRSARGWAVQSGTVEISHLTLTDANGIIVDANATIVPEAGGVLHVAGSLTTICPRSVLAAMTGQGAPREYRARIPLRIAFGGPVGAVVPLTQPSGLGAFTVRAQEMPCPVLRR